MKATVTVRTVITIDHEVCVAIAANTTHEEIRSAALSSVAQNQVLSNLPAGAVVRHQIGVIDNHEQMETDPKYCWSKEGERAYLAS